jgi:acrylyl-CoA reductase (NADPH)
VPTMSVRAFVAEQRDGDVVRGLRELPEEELGEGDVLVRVAYSSVNYKDALASTAKGRVARISPLVPGIDLAGTVEAAPPGAPVQPGDAVLAHGYDIGVAHHGGFAELARLPQGWIVPLPDGLDARQAMTLGTAGYTAGLSVIALEERGLRPGDGPVLVTGASGGVGCTAVAILAARGHEVVASSGKDAGDFLRGLGASEVIGRDDVAGGGSRPLEAQRWAAAVDCVGGGTLAGILRTLRAGGAVAASGNTGGVELPTTVLPFILRGVALLGIDSVTTPLEARAATWRRLAGDLRPAGLEDALAREIGLEDLDGALAGIARGELRGRTVVRVGAS